MVATIVAIYLAFGVSVYLSDYISLVWHLRIDNDPDFRQYLHLRRNYLRSTLGVLDLVLMWPRWVILWFYDIFRRD